MKRQILGLVPARGGSKGIPRKNLVKLAGKTLIQLTAEAALGAKTLNRVILSTDDSEIAEAGRRCGLEVPFMRPAELAQDGTPTLPVIQHALRFLEAHGERYDAVCLLQPTSPLRKPEQIDACVTLLFEEEVDAVITVLPVPHQYNPHWVFFEDGNGHLRLSTGASEIIPRRQLLPPAYHREGSIYVIRREVLLERNSIFGEKTIGYEMEPEQSINIDTMADLSQAERILKDRIVRPLARIK